MEEPKRRRRWTTTDLVAVILAGSMGVALNLFIAAAAIEAYANAITLPVGLSDNATQILGAWGGGMISVVGALVGVRIGRALPERTDHTDDADRNA